MTTYKDISAHEGTWGDFKGEHNYSLTTAEDAHHTTKTTAAKITSGEVCANLGTNWEQHLGVDPYPTPTGNKGLYYTRTVSNEYGTVCLPFALKSNEDITYYTFNPDVKTDDSNVVLKFEKTDYVDAGKPVLFRTSKTGELTFRNADSSFREYPYYSLSEYFAWYIAGTYEQQVFSESTSPSSDIVYYLSNGVIKNAKNVTIAPHRAWIGGPTISELTAAGAKAIQIEIEDEDGTTTALEFVGEDIVPAQKDGKAYSIMGTEVDNNYRGIVIKNGKKVIK